MLHALLAMAIIIPLDQTVQVSRGTKLDVNNFAGDVMVKVWDRDAVRVEVNHSDREAADIKPDLSAETTNGSIILDRVDSTNVDLYTVSGNISYDGPIKDKGLYRLTTHNGMIAVAVPERVNAVLTVRTYNGSFRSTFPI